MVVTIILASNWALFNLPYWAWFGGGSNGMIELARTSGGYSDGFVIMALVGVVPACSTILLSAIPKKIPVIGSKWFNVLVCTPVFYAYFLLWVQIKMVIHFSGKEFTYDVHYYLWVFGLGLIFISAFFNNRRNTKTG